VANIIARATVGRDKSRPYILRASFVLLVLLLAGCGGGGFATNTPVALPADLPAYPNTDRGLSTIDSRSFPQIAQYDNAEGFTFTSPDSAAAIRLWYKDQLTSKGWQVVADGSNLLGLTTANRDKLIELFLTSSASGAGSTKVVVYYASGRKPTPTRLKSAGRGLTNRSLMRIIKRTQQRSSAVERWPSG
jgi:hypothetical protein